MRLSLASRLASFASRWPTVHSEIVGNLIGLYMFWFATSSD
jgi:hypothetical protein